MEIRREQLIPECSNWRIGSSMSNRPEKSSHLLDVGDHCATSIIAVLADTVNKIEEALLGSVLYSVSVEDTFPDANQAFLP